MVPDLIVHEVHRELCTREWNARFYDARRKNVLNKLLNNDHNRGLASDRAAGRASDEGAGGASAKAAGRASASGKAASNAALDPEKLLAFASSRR